jgi:uncharacterized protein YodC (DUF2158 family)
MAGKFTEGDKVRLKGGMGPLMIVEHYDKLTDYVYCAWHDPKAGFLKKEFLEAALEEATDPPPTATGIGVVALAKTVENLSRVVQQVDFADLAMRVETLEKEIERIDRERFQERASRQQMT